MIAGSLALITAPTANAAAGSCGFTGAVNTFNAQGGVSGDVNDPAMWDAGTVPNSEQACIPAGKTALIPNSAFALGTTLRVLGTLKVSGDNVVMGGGAVPHIENFGRIESPLGTKIFFNTSGSITNR